MLVLSEPGRPLVGIRLFEGGGLVVGQGQVECGHGFGQVVRFAGPDDRGLTDLIGELCTRSEAFRTRWAAHDVRLHRTGVKDFCHPVAGRLDLTVDAMEIPTDRGLTMTCYTAEPGTAPEENLKLLASWAATREQGAMPPDSTARDSTAPEGTGERHPAR